jgi:IPT/TIG domain
VYGTVFSISAGLEPFVKTNPTSGKVGTRVIILGNDLADTTSVTFNGTPARFKASNAYISTRVPPGASTGTVEVVTPEKTLKSNVPFRVAKCDGGDSE